MKRKVDELIEMLNRTPHAVFNGLCIVEGKEYKPFEDIESSDPCAFCMCGAVSILYVF